MLTDEQRDEHARDLVEAERTGQWTKSLVTVHPDATIEDAYHVAAAVTGLKQQAGRVVKGHKIGLVSRAMREVAGATEPDYGALFDDWFVAEGDVLDISRLNRPQVEVEVAFVLGRDIDGRTATAADVISATDYVLPALEVVDSRYSSSPGGVVDSVADAASCGRVVLGGNPVGLRDIDIRDVAATLFVNGEPIRSGMSSAVMGNPVNAIVWLARKLAEFGVTLEAGHVVLPGSFLQLAPFRAGDTVSAVFSAPFGSVGFGVR
ncbi:2-keto-4-pentenoate hydratase [Nocardia sp. CA-120079]|uniref:2-keto-4-pentenoate hydratase n=1 Tax=Nocardia sp. CA-120079 TaxID=3239974 RepID=UPI003D99C9A5